MDSREVAFHTALQTIAGANRWRQIRTVDPLNRPDVLLEEHPVVDFSSNDYLGLSGHPALIEAAQEAACRYGTGVGGSRLIGGTLPLHPQLEKMVVDFKDTEAALILNSGYQATIGILSALIGRHDIVFADRLNHASLVDGVVLSRARCVRYPHLDMGTLAQQLSQTPQNKTKWIITDTVFSMDGDLAPLEKLYALSERYQTWLILDEAHATGVFGDVRRSGLWETTGLGRKSNVIHIGTFSKALGSFGAYVAGSQTIIETLIQRCRSLIYSTALPAPVVAANLAALELIMNDAAYTQQLWNHIRLFDERTRQPALPATPVQSPIVPVLLYDVDKTLFAESQLLDAGYFVHAIRPPTVPEGTSRLRISLSASHTPQQIKGLANTLCSVMDSVNQPVLR